MLKSLRRAPLGLVSLMLFSCGAGMAREPSAEPWPQISKEQLALKDNPAEPGASAMILYREVADDDVKGFGTNVYCIKVFTEKGKEYADIEIPYIPKALELEDIRARVLQPDGKVEDFNGQIYDKTSLKFKKRRLQVKAFTLPNVQVGSVIEYSYTARWRWKEPDVLKHPADYIFKEQWTIPAVSWDIQEDLFTRRARFSLRPLPNAPVGWTIRAFPNSPRPQQMLPDLRYVLEVENVPAYREEEFMPPEDATRSRIHFYYGVGGLPSSEGYWSSIARVRTEDIERFLDKRKAMENEVRSIISPGDSDLGKLQKIYARAQQVRFLSFEYEKTDKERKKENIHENKNVEDVLKHNYANANEANLLFIGLARAAGFSAWPVAVSDRANTLFDREYPNAGQLNALVVGVHVGSKDLFLDPATLFCPFGLLPWGENGTKGISLGGTSTLFAATAGPQSSEAIVRREVKAQLDKDGNVDGTIHVVFSGQEALIRRLGAYQTDEAGRKKELEDEVKGWLPMGATVALTSSPEWEKAAETLEAQFSLKVPNVVTRAGHRRVLPLTICQGGAKYPFESSQRIHPVYFSYPYQEIDQVTLQLPGGYEVESVPEGRKVNAAFATYNTSYQKKAETVEFERRMAMEGIWFRTEYYSSLRAFYRSVRSGDEDQIVLKTQEVAAKK